MNVFQVVTVDIWTETRRIVAVGYEKRLDFPLNTTLIIPDIAVYNNKLLKYKRICWNTELFDLKHKKDSVTQYVITCPNVTNEVI